MDGWTEGQRGMRSGWIRHDVDVGWDGRMDRRRYKSAIGKEKKVDGQRTPGLASTITAPRRGLFEPTRHGEY